MPGCSVKKCGNNSSKPADYCDGKPVTFHQFPADEERKEIWADAIRKAGKIGKVGEKWTPNRNSKICSVHFIEEHIERTLAKKDNSRQMTRLTKDAVPSIFPKLEKNIKKDEIKIPQKKSASLPDQPLLSYSPPPMVHDNDILDRAIAGIDLFDMKSEIDIVFSIMESFEGGNTTNLSIDAVTDFPTQLLSEDPVDTKPVIETKKMVVMPSETGGETIIFPIPKAKPFLPSEAEQQAGPSKTEEEDDDACCGGFTDLDSVLCSTVKDGKADDLAKEFRSGMEALQALQTKLYHLVPPERLNNFGSLLELLSKEGRELLKESKVITDQIRLFKRYEPLQVSHENVKRLCEDQQNVVQASSTSQLLSGLDQVDMQPIIGLDEEMWKALIEGIFKQ